MRCVATAQLSCARTDYSELRTRCSWPCKLLKLADCSEKSCAAAAAAAAPAAAAAKGIFQSRPKLVFKQKNNRLRASEI